MKRSVACLILLWFAATLACSGTAEPTFPAPPITTRVVGGDGGTETAGQTPVATLTSAAPAGGEGDPTPTLAIASTVSLDELGDVPETLDELATWLGAAYQGEVELSEICAALLAAEWQTGEETCEEADLEGDEEAEWLLGINTTRLGAEIISPEGYPGDFWIVHEGGVYQVLAERPEWTGAAPVLVEAVDMTGDENPEVVTMALICGASTCVNEYRILSMHEGELASIVEAELPEAEGEEVTEASPEVISLSFVEEEALEDATDDGLVDLVLTGGTFGSVGAGIHRARTEVWAWDGTAVVLADQEFEQTNYRHHRLYDANLAFEEGNYELAAQLYEQVVVDQTLVDEPSLLNYSAEDTRRYAQQFAAFRLAYLPLLRGDITEATRWRNWLHDSYPEAAITQAAALLLSTWETNRNDLNAACVVVTEFLEEQADPTGPLADMGYANPFLTAEDVCPAG